jgi:hypothetical protein
MAAADFEVLYQRLQGSSVWGTADRRGALNNITQAHVLAAMREVRVGRTTTLAAPVESQVTVDNPDPCVHQVTSAAGDQADPTGLSFAMDRLAMNVHGNADSHIDALCHVIYRADLYNGGCGQHQRVRGIGAVYRGGPRGHRRARCPARRSAAARLALA